MNSAEAKSTRVCIQSFTYSKSRGCYRVRNWFHWVRMDSHVAAMLAKGWKVLSAVQPSPESEGSITLLFGRAHA